MDYVTIMYMNLCICVSSKREEIGEGTGGQRGDEGGGRWGEFCGFHDISCGGYIDILELFDVH